MMDKKHIYKLIRNFEFEAGEDFIDQNEHIVNAKCILFWMFGKGYINGDKIKIYGEDPNQNFIGLTDVLKGYEAPYSLFPYGECEEDCHFKAMEILAEFISECEMYQNRLMKIMNEYEQNSSYLKRDKDLDEEYNFAISLSIDELNEKYKS